MIYKERLKELREKYGLKQTELCKILNVDNSALSHYENEDIIIPTKHLITLCNYYNVSIDYILGFNDILNYNNISNENKTISGQRLKEFRKENKLTQNKLATILNAGQPTIANYENGTYLIALPFLYTICKKYNISADYLLGKTDAPKYLKLLINYVIMYTDEGNFIQ
ncbi:MAG: helix-turn-helix domain-containing protein [Ruminococcus sp.]|nr:helix-turn-helix domain-containing protein [Ruminococcus sp.]